MIFSSAIVRYHHDGYCNKVAFNDKVTNTDRLLDNEGSHMDFVKLDIIHNFTSGKL